MVDVDVHQRDRMRELFDLSRHDLKGLTRSEQLQCLMARLVWDQLVHDPAGVVEQGRRRQGWYRKVQPWRSYLDEWDVLLDDVDRIVEIYGHYDRENSGLLTNSPLGVVIDQRDRREMLGLLREHREGGLAA